MWKADALITTHVVSLDAWSSLGSIAVLRRITAYPNSLSDAQQVNSSQSKDHGFAGNPCVAYTVCRFPDLLLCNFMEYLEFCIELGSVTTISSTALPKCKISTQYMGILPTPR
ncbi:hypothetical protein MRB53_041498 [Persea americana]|nr:hypothetical protein MRB53_041498 [Persea americana]